MYARIVRVALVHACHSSVAGAASCSFLVAQVVTRSPSDQVLQASLSSVSQEHVPKNQWDALDRYHFQMRAKYCTTLGEGQDRCLPLLFPLALALAVWSLHSNEWVLCAPLALQLPCVFA